MTYKEAFRLIRSDYQRYADLESGGVKCIKIWLHNRGFVYTFWLRLAAVNSLLKPLFWLIHHHLSSKYGMQIPTQTSIGAGLYVGHGVGVVINPTAKIGKNVTLSQFLTIGSTRGKAAKIEDNVYIGPSVCLVEDVIIGHDSVVGAGAVVTKDVPPYSVAVGVPAKVVKHCGSNDRTDN